MNEIGEQLRFTREGSGISLEEASNDLKIKEMILENIEEGNIGCFKDIFILKEYIYNYAKYLGIDPEAITDEFNEYLFEYTSKIPLTEIEKAVNDQPKENSDKVVSPYTKMPSKYKKKNFVVIYIAIAILVILAIVWSVRQITVNNAVTNQISYVE